MASKEIPNLSECLPHLGNAGYMLLTVVPCVRNIVKYLEFDLDTSLAGLVGIGFGIPIHCFLFSYLYEQGRVPFHIRK